MKNNYYIFILFLFWITAVHSQGVSSIDEVSYTKSYVDKIITAYDNNSIASSDKLTEIIIIADQLNYKNGVISGYERLVDLYKKKKNASLQLRSLLLELNYLKKNEYSDQLKEVYLSIGNIYYSYNLFDKANENYLYSDSVNSIFPKEKRVELSRQIELSYYNLKYYKEAIIQLKLHRSIGEESQDWQVILWSLQQEAKIAHARTEFKEELSINKKILNLTDSLNLEKEKIIAINNVGYSYKYLKDYKEAEIYFLSVLTDKESKVNGIIYQNRAIIKQNAGRFDPALIDFKKALDIHEKNKDYDYEAKVLDYMAIVYYQKSDFYNAQKYNRLAISNSKEHLMGEVYKNSYYTQSKINQSLYEYEDALNSMNRYLEIKDSLDRIQDLEISLIKLQQLFLDKTEEELNVQFISEELKDLELKRLLAEQVATEERIKRLASDIERYSSDSLFNMQKLLTQRLKINEFENLLEIQYQESEIITLAGEKKEKELALKLEQIEGKKKEEALLLEKKGNEILELKLKERQLFVRNLIFFSAGLLVFVILIIIFYINIRKKKIQIDKQRGIILAEKDKSESLLLNILPISVAEELKEKGKSPPRYFEEVTIIFTDFSGFTKIAEKLTPVQLVEKLDEIFLEFDLIVEKHGLNRIKTIGDAYMCAAGIPDVDINHAENAVKSALEMRDFIIRFNNELSDSEPQWNIRIGINTGAIVAGVVGVKKFAYDIWGDAVNVAARMESSGGVNKVNISESTFKIVKDKFKTSHRGKVYAKNKGDIDMYFVESETN